MFDLASTTELLVKDFCNNFKSYPDEFPFRDPACLTRSPDIFRKELTKMHSEDEANDQLIADQLKTQVITGSQSQGAEHAQQNALILSDIRQQAGVKPSSKKGAKTVLSLNSYLHQWILRMFSARSRMPVVSS